MHNSSKAFAALAADLPLQAADIQRRAPGPGDVVIRIQYCGVCHSDIHQARNEWHDTLYPCVPGHEIVGTVTETGVDVQKFTIGDQVAVGCLVDSCGSCSSCEDHLEQHCANKPVFTYNSPEAQTGAHTYGGYSQRIVVDQGFVLSLPAELDPAAAAPLLCAGITTYSPLRRFGVGPGTKLGVIGLGGLGHMAIKLAHALGAEVTLFSRSPGKADDARRFGASEIVITRDPQALKPHRNRYDLIIDTVSANHDINTYLQLLNRGGTMVLVGIPEEPLSLGSFSLIQQQRLLTGSLIGGIQETQEMLNFCAEHDIVCEIEMIPIQMINAAYERMLDSDVKYRFVIDMASLD